MAKTRTTQQAGALLRRPGFWYAAASVVLASASAVVMMQPSRRVLRKARRCVGIREIQQNAGFSDKDFQADMAAAGWYVGAQWCAFFVKMVVLSRCRKGSDGYAFWSKAINGNTNATWANLQKPSPYHEISQKPIPRSIVIYGGVQDASLGHIEFVDRVKRDGSYTVISGNDTLTDNSGQGVAARTRPSTGPNAAKYKILGFIKIKKL